MDATSFSQLDFGCQRVLDCQSLHSQLSLNPLGKHNPTEGEKQPECFTLQSTSSQNENAHVKPELTSFVPKFWC